MSPGASTGPPLEERPGHLKQWRSGSASTLGLELKQLLRSVLVEAACIGRVHGLGRHANARNFSDLYTLQTGSDVQHRCAVGGIYSPPRLGPRQVQACPPCSARPPRMHSRPARLQLAPYTSHYPSQRESTLDDLQESSRQ